MTQFLRLLAEDDKAQALLETCTRLRAGEPEPRHFEVAPSAFDAVPGKPFAYWVSEAVRETFRRLPKLESNGRKICSGPDTGQDFRCIRTWWECPYETNETWELHAKGGAFGRFYADLYLTISWDEGGKALKSITSANIRNPDRYFRPGLTWPLRTTSGISFRVMPAGGIFGHKGPAAFVSNDDPDELLALLALTNSRPFSILVELQLAAADAAARSYEVGVIQKTPIPPLTTDHRPPTTAKTLTTAARRAWSLKRSLDTANQTSHAFTLPALLQVEGDTLAERAAAWDRRVAETQQELAEIQRQIDDICFDLYGFSEADRAAALAGEGADGSHEDEDEGDDAA